MHFHVIETMMGEAPHDLGGDHAVTYPSRRPTFDTVDGAVDAVMGSAFEHWGPSAEVHVEVSLEVELSMRREDTAAGAVTGWTETSSEGATWVLRSCECADGALAQLFATDRP